jgi:hypothetical protein
VQMSRSPSFLTGMITLIDAMPNRLSSFDRQPVACDRSPTPARSVRSIAAHQGSMQSRLSLARWSFSRSLRQSDDPDHPNDHESYHSDDAQSWSAPQ